MRKEPLFSEGPDSPAPVSLAPDSLLLAAYLDGRLDPDGREHVEAWLAADPHRLDVLLGAQDALAAGSEPAPDALVAQAQGLVAPAAPDAGGVPRDGAAESALWSRLYWPSAAAAVLMACVLGFQLGQSRAAQTALADADILVLTDDPIGELALDLTDLGLPI